MSDSPQYSADVHSTDPTTTYKALFIGCLLAVLGNLLISVSLNIQKYSHMQDEEKDLEAKIHYLRRPIWWLGISLMGLGEIGNFSAYGYAPASVVAPLGSTTVIANMFIAVIFLKEKLRPVDLFGAALAVVGAFLLVNFSSKKEYILNSQGIVDALTQSAFIVYICIEITALAVLFFLLYKMKMENVLVLLLITSILASFTVISAKACSSMIKLTFRGSSQLGHPVIYVMALIMAVTAVIQIKYLNYAMKLFHSTIVVPTNFVFFTISAITAGIVFYKEMWGMSALQMIMFLFGCILCFLGVFFITTGRAGDSLKESAQNEEWMANIIPTWLFSTFSRAKVQPPQEDNGTALLLTSPASNGTTFHHEQVNKEEGASAKNEYGSQSHTLNIK